MGENKEGKKENTGNTKVTAPYNFVPFSSKVLEYEGELPEHNKIYSELKTGEIHLKITAETPIFISDGSKTEEVCRFYKNGNGRFAIPGSSIRGLIRENMQILGFGQFDVNENFEDYQIFYRSIAAKSESDDAALHGYYTGLLGVRPKQEKSSGKKNSTVTVPLDVKAGYLINENGSYVIYPTQNDYIRIRRGNDYIKEDIYAKEIPVFYKGDNNKNIVINYNDSNNENGMKHGVLLYTGKPVNKVNAVYLFPDMDKDAIPVTISSEDIKSYSIDYENRKNVLGADREFWNIINNDGPKAVFYVQKNGHVYFGRSLFLRVGYEHPLSYGLHKIHKDKKVLDYPHAIMGYADINNESYKSRISCEDCVAEKNYKEGNVAKVTLASPKASYYKNYVEDGKHYNDDSFKLRGYKQYWFKESVEEEAGNRKDNVSTSIVPLKEGTVFSGTIRFKNLNDIEFGLLLWCIKLNGKESYHGIGMAKPYGYGRVKIEIDELNTVNYKNMYDPAHIFDDPYEIVDEDQQQAYIKKYKEYASTNLISSDGKKKKVKLNDNGTIESFMLMRKTIMKNDDCKYMELSEFKNANKLKNIKEVIEESGANDEETTEENMLEKLLQWSNSKSNRKKGK